MKIPPNEHDLHAYVDGRLDESERAIIERYLAQHPSLARQVQSWRDEAQCLRATLAGLPLPDLTTTLDPAAIRARKVRRTHTRMQLAASFVLCIALGSLGGWQARGWQNTSHAPMGDALNAYKLMVVEKSMPADFTPDGANTLTAWLSQHVGSGARMPDLRQAGFTPVSGRLFATEQGAAAMVLYQDDHGHTISFYIRPPDYQQHPLVNGQRSADGLIALYGSSQGLNYAVVGPAGMINNPAISRELRKQA
ncbi:anti-sigma factor [Serratia rubidaea]|uniref:anti-sigma factor family protein n=1 Tax=Serratia rubidaea TaxID=61652 RepID=UPI001F23BAF3|nr:anti-sigma factor [Serratia rubidaea]UJD79343.1 anti-sigma factor [Serratia rubidaea]UJD83897.1 anti-sigma factor [Serratia rubidaea]